MTRKPMIGRTVRRLRSCAGTRRVFAATLIRVPRIAAVAAPAREREPRSPRLTSAT